MPEINPEFDLSLTWLSMCHQADWTRVLLVHFGHEDRITYALGSMAIDALGRAGAYRILPEDLPQKSPHAILTNAWNHLGREWRKAHEADDSERAKACADAIRLIAGPHPKDNTK